MNQMYAGLDAEKVITCLFRLARIILKKALFITTIKYVKLKGG